MPVLDLQRQGQQIGRLRIGQQVATKNGKMRPAKLDAFRFTTASRHTANAIAAEYGGEVHPWEGHTGQWEVITGRSEIGVTIPPRDAIISQWYEMWNKGGALRRCDSQTDQISGGPCQCPHAAPGAGPEEIDRVARERSDLAHQNPPEACKLVTRISVMIPDLPGLGVFRLDTGSYYAGVEIGDAAALLQHARDHKVFLPAMLRIEQRQRVAGGETKNYPVPVLDVIPTFREIASGAIEQAGIMAQLPPAPGEQMRALTAGTAIPPAAIAEAEAAAAEPVGFDGQLAAIGGINLAIAGVRIVELARTPGITPAQMNQLQARAKELEVWEDQVCTEEAPRELWEPLCDFWQGRWAELKRAAQARSQADAA